MNRRSGRLPFLLPYARIELCDHEDKYRVARSYQIVYEATGKPVFASRAFLDDHADAEIIQALQNLGLLVSLRRAGARRVTVKSQMIEIEAGA